jgi:hypothetical protein
MKNNKKSKKYSRKNLNDNCFVLTPDGEVLNRASLSKLNWYVKKELADFEKPIFDMGVYCDCIRLRFEPFNRNIGGNSHFKLNCCVSCGQTENIFCNSIIPSEYKKVLPIFLKSKMSHDNFFFCLKCSDKLLNANKEFSNDLAIKFNCPVKYDSSKYVNDYSKKKARSACIMYNNLELSESRKEEYCNIIKDYFKVDNITDDIILIGTQLSKYKEIEGWKSHGELIVEGIINDYKEAQRKGEEPEFKKWIINYHSNWELFKEYKLNKDFIVKKDFEDENLETFNIFYPFILMWRIRFLEIMQPKYLDKYWSVYSRISMDK